MIAAVVERTVEIALLGLIAFPLARLAIDPGVRRRFRAFPRVQAAMAGALLLYASIVAVIALTEPALLRSMRRIGYALASPMIPAVLLWRHRSGISRAIRRERPPFGTTATLVLCSLFEAAGESVGYALGGEARTRERYDDYEIRRLDYARGVRRTPD